MGKLYLSKLSIARIFFYKKIFLYNKKIIAFIFFLWYNPGRLIDLTKFFSNSPLFTRNFGNFSSLKGAKYSSYAKIILDKKLHKV